ncbi:MAG TPA: SpoIID/LytB domain-containing protein [Candidatus Limnocylindrales bacterium]
MRALAVLSVAVLGLGLLPGAGFAADRWPTPPPAPPGFVRPPRPTIPPKSVTSYTFYGRGWGHGVGMSQYGARGRALAGQTSATILAHYYPKTTLGQADPSTIVRVLVLSGFAASTAKPLTITGRLGTWTIDGVAGTFAADARVTLVPTSSAGTSWTLRVLSAANAQLAARTITAGAVMVRPAASSTYLELTTKGATYDLYRGSLNAILRSTASVVNHVPVDLYLRGVVPLEMPAGWPSEALKVQAIAARSYALYRVHTSGSYDLYDDTRSQVYRGRRGEATATNTAIAATSGTVVLSGGKPANTLFHSSDGGWTENNENVFVSSTGAIVAGAVSYLRGSSDRAPDGSSYDQTSPYATWKTATYSIAALSAVFAKDSRTAVGTIASLDLSRTGVSGRLISVTLRGSGGTKTVSGAVFVSAFNAGRSALDPQMRGTLFATAPIP